MSDDLAARRGKRGVITIKVGTAIRTMQIPLEQTRVPIAALKARGKPTS